MLGEEFFKSPRIWEIKRDVKGTNGDISVRRRKKHVILRAGTRIPGNCGERTVEGQGTDLSVFGEKSPEREGGAAQTWKPWELQGR